MRLRIVVHPRGVVDGVSLEHFHVGEIYDLAHQVASVFLVEGWAEIVWDDESPVFVRRPSRAVSALEPLVLVVEDEPPLRRLTEKLLTSHGYRVSVAIDGRDGILRLEEQCPDLIVLDLKMPIMDGWAFRAEQRHLTDRTRAAVPVLLMTAARDAAVHAAAMRAVGVVKKPFNSARLLGAVSAAILAGHNAGSAGLGSALPS
jgi:CheY-like chemotaxis protein